MGKNRKCLICGGRVRERFDYCSKCFESKIHELQLKYGVDEEGPSDQPRKDDREAHREAATDDN